MNDWKRCGVFGLFFFSGLSGLIYEVLWVRHLTLTFGNTVFATSTVLAAYMGGLALGAWYFGKRADRTSRPLLLYASLEAAIGVSALLFPLVLHLCIPILRSLYQSDQFAALAGVRFALAFVLLLLPTAAMGGTLPALARLMTQIESAGGTLSKLYGINTLGAAAGTILCGFFLLPTLGLNGTLAVAVALNALVAGFAFWLGRRWFPVETGVSTKASESGLRAPPINGRQRFVLVAFLVSGALALALEVLWTRSLLLVFGSTVYSFSTMLAIFLLGLAIGSFVAGRLADRLSVLIAALGLAEVGVAFVTLISNARINELPRQFLDGLLSRGFTWDNFLMTKLLIAAGVLLPVAILFGATFPLVAKMEVFSNRKVGGQVGILYAFNTAGAIIGSLGAGFFLLPVFGLQRALFAVAWTALFLGVVLILMEEPAALQRSWRIALAAVMGLVGVAALVQVKPWDQRVLSAGVYFRPQTYLSADGRHNIMDETLGNLAVLDYEEGLTETAAVLQTPISRMFVVDGKVEAATDLVDMRLQILQGVLPMLFAPRTDRAINIGLGCGITLGGLKLFPLRNLECVELEPRILKTARYFAAENHQVLDDPRLKIHINDGRNHLLLTGERYDVITSDPFEPIVGGAASLYTEDHFRNGRDRLSQGGIFCQYLPMYQLSPADYQMIIRSFCKVFPHVSCWYTGIDTILLGSVEPHTKSLAELSERMSLPEVKEGLAAIGVSTPLQLLQTFVADPADAEGIGTGPLNTDSHPYIEFSAPRSHLINTTPQNLSWLIANRRPADLPITSSTQEERATIEHAGIIGEAVMQAALARFSGRNDEALERSRKVLPLDPKNRAVLFEISASANLGASYLLGAGKLNEAKSLLEEALTTGEEPLSTLSGLATWAFKSANPAEALSYTKRALELAPNVPDTNLRMALCYLALNQPAEALHWSSEALRLNPLFLRAELVRGDAALALDRRDMAAASYGRALAGGASEEPSDWLRYGLVLADLGRWSEAKDAFKQATRLSPADPAGWYYLARAAKALGQKSVAGEAYSKALSIAPDQVKKLAAEDPLWKTP